MASGSGKGEVLTCLSLPITISAPDLREGIVSLTANVNDLLDIVAVGTNAKCRPGPETSDVRGRADVTDRRSNRRD
jgi:hypothetical protein